MAEQIPRRRRQEVGRITPLYLRHPVPDATTPTPSELERGVSSSSRRRSSTAAAIAIAITTTVTDAITAAYAAVTAPSIKH